MTSCPVIIAQTLAADPGEIWTRLTWCGIAAAVSGALAWWGTSRAAAGEIKNLHATVKRLTEDVRALTDALAMSREERVQCELRTARTYMTKDELVRATANGERNFGELKGAIESLGTYIRSDVGKIHERINPLLERVAALESAGGKTL